MQAALIPPASWAGALVKAPPSYLFPLGGEQGLRACGRPRRCVSALSDLEGGRPGPVMNTEGASSLPPRQACLPGYVRSLSGFQECGAAMRPGTTGAALAIPGGGAGEQQSDQDQASRRGRLEGHLPSSARSWLQGAGQATRKATVFGSPCTRGREEGRAKEKCPRATLEAGLGLTLCPQVVFQNQEEPGSPGLRGPAQPSEASAQRGLQERRWRFLTPPPGKGAESDRGARAPCPGRSRPHRHTPGGRGAEAVVGGTYAGPARRGGCRTGMGTRTGARGLGEGGRRSPAGAPAGRAPQVLVEGGQRAPGARGAHPLPAGDRRCASTHLAHRRRWSARRWPCRPPTCAASPGPR